MLESPPMSNIEIHGLPMDLGVALRGVDMGPSALRIAGLLERLQGLGYQVTDGGELHMTSRALLPEDDSSARYVDEIAAICERIAEVAERAKARDSVPIFLGGDHSIAVGTVTGVAAHYHAHGQALGVIWFDAHADMNTPETSPSGNVHGMPLAALLGEGVDALIGVGGRRGKILAENVVIIGVRDVDSVEREVVKESGVHVFSMSAIDALGMSKVAAQAIELASAGTAGIHLSFDVDGLDPSFAPGVATPVMGGVSFREAHLFMEMIARSHQLVSMDITELNPVRDTRNMTAETVVHLVESAFGRRVIGN